MIKRILYPLTKSIRTWDIPYALKLLGLEPLLADLPCEASSAAGEDADRMVQIIREQQAECVMTHDFQPYAAIACEACGIPYIAWIWDAPQDVLFHESIRLGNSYLFDFDRRQAEETAARGAAHVQHMPLAGNVHRMEQIELTEADERRVACDISFIGSLYGGEDWSFAEEQLSEPTRDALRTVIEQGIARWDGTDRLTGRLSEEQIAEIAGGMTEHPYIRSVMGDRTYIEQVKLARHIAHRERVEALRRLAWRGLRLYTWNGERALAESLTGVHAEGQLDYLAEVPKAYFLSRINLNLTLPSIRSGVPLRVFEILAAGGFVLTNYQAELEDLFVIGQEIEAFHSLEEMEDKVAYYLSHEEERLRITRRGYQKVRDRYSYEQQTARILAEVEAQWRG